jgi:two-component sensor histidine kinase
MIDAFLNALPKKPQPALIRYGVTTFVVIAFYILQELVVARSEVFGFFLMYPAIFFAGVAYDRGSGFWATGVSTALLIWSIMGHEGGQLPQSYFLPLLLFVIIGGLVAALSEALRHEWERAVSAEKTTALLMRELQHRTKNDLSTAAAVLSLQARANPNSEVGAALADARDRLQVLSKSHEHFEDEGSQNIQMKPFIEGICANLTDTMQHRCTVKVDAICAEIALPRERAVPIGLVVNELITNAFKHGFPTGGEGRVQVTLKDGGDVCLEVEDNGKGCPKETRVGMGTLLIEQLTKQLGGTIERIEAHPGCKVTLRVPQ